MTQEQLLAELKPHVERLHGLLQAPETGLQTWTLMMLSEWKAIAELWAPEVRERIS